jgi:hypothetical protein
MRVTESPRVKLADSIRILAFGKWICGWNPIISIETVSSGRIDSNYASPNFVFTPDKPRVPELDARTVADPDIKETVVIVT